MANLVCANYDGAGNQGRDPEQNPGVLSQIYILGQSAVPRILLPAGTVNASGQFTLGTALPYVPNGVVFVYMFAGIGLAAGLYQATFSSTTVCQLVGNPVTTAGAYAGGTTEAVLAQIPMTGNSMGPNGAIRITTLQQVNNTANNKYAYSKFAGAVLSAANLVSTVSMEIMKQVRNRGDAGRQVLHSTSQLGAASTVAPVAYAIDTTQQQFITVTAQLVTATDYMILEAYTVELLPGA